MKQLLNILRMPNQKIKAMINKKYKIFHIRYSVQERCYYLNKLNSSLSY